jgi:hypothetical protein
MVISYNQGSCIKERQILKSKKIRTVYQEANLANNSAFVV